MKTSEWVLVWSTIILAVAALVAPVVTEWLKRRFWAPRLSLDFRLSKPDCHSTNYLVGRVAGVTIPDRPVYVYRLRITNNGRSQAKRCEVVVEGIARRNAARELVWHDTYTPVPLIWGSGNGEFVELNKDRMFFCDFLFIPHPDHQSVLKQGSGWLEWPNTGRTSLGVEVKVSRSFFSQPNWLPSGDYRFRIAVFSDNAPVVRSEFDLAWSGTWAVTEEAMFNECVDRAA